LTCLQHLLPFKDSRQASRKSELEPLNGPSLPTFA
jgi:hypothetical protein